MMESIFTFDGLGIWMSCFLTLAVFSFLYRDNPIYKITEHVYVGIAAGYYIYQAFKGTIYPNLVQHVYEGIQKIAAGQPGGWASQWRWGAMIMGMLMLSRLLPKGGWISRWPMALIVGAFAGLNLVGYVQANLMDQIHATFVPLTGVVPGMESAGPIPFWPILTEAGVGAPSTVNHVVLVVGVISVLSYFLFSTTERGRLRWLQSIGIAFVMITFGATYGSIVLARISLLIGRVQHLTDSNQATLGYPPVICAVVIVVALVVWRLLILKPEPGEPEADSQQG